MSNQIESYPRIMLSRPEVSGNEQKYIDAAMADDWIVPLGPHVDEFERRLAAYIGVDNVVALSAGTAALHLGLVMLGVEAGDEVICQSLTFSASANPIVYCGASPIFVASERETWNMDAGALREAILERRKAKGRLPKAIVAVDLYGMPVNWYSVSAVAEEFGISVLEDAAEALGSCYAGKKCGVFGKYGVLSFNGNKMITTSGGGALICPDADAAKRVKFLATQARENRPYYYHQTIGYNYRLSNISAAIGCGQMEDIDRRIDRRRAIHKMYADAFADSSSVRVHNNPNKEFDSNFWLTTVLFSSEIDPDKIRIALAAKNIETRLLWRPMAMQPVFQDCPVYGDTSIDADLFGRGLCLPSGASLTDEDVCRVIDSIKEELEKL